MVVVPAQPLAVGTMAYVTVPLVLPVLVRVSAGMVVVPVAVLPLMDAVAVEVHVNVVPGTAAVSVTAVVVAPEQIDCDRGVLETVGLGLTVMVVEIVFPVQVSRGLPATWVGVMVYVTDKGPAVLFCKVWLIVGELCPTVVLPLAAFVIPAGAVTVQLNAFPVEGVFAPSAIAVPVPEQIVLLEGVAVPTGLGLTMILYVAGTPGHVLPPPAVAIAT